MQHTTPTSGYINTYGTVPSATIVYSITPVAILIVLKQQNVIRNTNIVKATNVQPKPS